jgi:hypothetical protein
MVQQNHIDILLAMVGRDEPQMADPASYADFYKCPRPVSNQVTLLAGYQGPVLPIQFRISRPKDPTVGGVRVLFHFQRLILMTLFVDAQDHSRLNVPGGFQNAAHILWPMERVSHDSTSMASANRP